MRYRRARAPGRPVNSTAIRIVAAVVGVAVIIVAIALSRGGDDAGGAASSIATPATAEEPVPSEAAATAPADAVRVSIAYSPEKADLMAAAIAEFNAKGVEVEGRPVFVEGERVASGASFDRLRAGSLQPVIWVAGLVALGPPADGGGGRRLGARPEPSRSPAPRS